MSLDMQLEQLYQEIQKTFNQHQSTRKKTLKELRAKKSLVTSRS